MGYRYEIPAEKLVPKFTADSKLALSSESIPTKVENAPIIGETVIHTLDDLKRLAGPGSRLSPRQADTGDLLPG